MDNGTSGSPLAVTLDGIHLAGISPDEVTIRPLELVHHRQGGDASGREARPWAETGHAATRIKYGFTLDWGTVRAKAPLMDRLLAIPGAHRLILWKHVTTPHESDGANQVLILPRALLQDALDHAGDPLQPPDGHPWSRFPVRVFVGGPLSAYVEPTPVDQATWDAGDPAAGVVWRLLAAPLLKLAPEDVPLPGVYVTVESVPELRVHRVAPGEVSYRSPIPEPRRLELQEV